MKLEDNYERKKRKLNEIDENIKKKRDRYENKENRKVN